MSPPHPSEAHRQSRNERLAAAVDREAAATDAEIDNLVYELYAITESERRIIERS